MATPNEKIIEAGHTIEIEGKDRQYDQTIINDPNWIILEEVMRMLKVTTARAVQYHADSPTKKKWLKKYAKINGRERVFYSRKDVTEFITSRGPTDTFESKTGESDQPQPAAANARPAEHVQASSDEKVHSSQETLPAIIVKAGETSPEIAKFVDFHMKIVDENKELKNIAHSAENKLVGWKTSLLWLAGITLVAGSALAWFAYANWDKVGELTRTKDELYTKTISLQDEVIKTKSQLMNRDAELTRRDAEIQKLRQPVEQVNAQQ